jgi:LysR family transcriptional regulator, nod-box dependent transcriptional activator
MRFGRLDLNLLVAFDVLMEEKSVSAAAKRLNLSQPAVSGALNRLRDFFGDELLVQCGRRMVVTAKAQELIAPVREALLLIGTRIATPAEFDPAEAERTFKVIASDYMFTVLLAEVFADLAAIAPGIGFEIMPPEPRTLELLNRGEADLLITIDTYIFPDFPYLSLFREEHSVICWSGSTHSRGIDAESFSTAGHAISYFGPARTQAFSEAFFEREGVPRRIEMRVPSFTMLPQAVIGTDRLATLQRRYAEYCARFLPITVLAEPFGMPELHEVAQWHGMRENDLGVRWLVRLIEARAVHLRRASGAREDL